MSRHLDNLKRLCKKMQRRYGENDAISLQVGYEVVACETRELNVRPQRDWSISYREFLKRTNSSASCSQ